MSAKITRAIQAVRTGERVAIWKDAPVLVGADYETKSESWVAANVYRIGVTAECRMVIAEDRERPYAEEAAKRNLVEHVFGEFRMNFRAIDQALWARDIEKARDLLDAMERQMFGV